ncbi:C40 family peptidase [Pontibacter sp. CAU 1760]
MDYGIGMLSFAPMRAETADKAELVTQLLFGECYEVVNQEGNWLQLELATDHYRGWIDVKQHTPVSAEYFKNWRRQSHQRVTDLLQVIQNGYTQIPVGIGSYLPFFDGKHILVDGQKLAYTGSASSTDVLPTQAQLMAVARQFMKAPYLWGGKSIFGIDCSGLMQQVFGICGFQLPRDASQQVACGEEVHFVEQALPGDMAFFSNPEGRIVHVGMVLEDQKIIHAHGEVRVDTLDHVGIHNAALHRYTHQLRLIKRILH